VVKALVLLVGRSRDRFSVVSLDFSVTYSSRPYHGPGVDTVPGKFSGGKGDRYVMLTTSATSRAECHGNLGA
jgi:hypothetical protein